MNKTEINGIKLDLNRKYRIDTVIKNFIKKQNEQTKLIDIGK
jgi:hypothetical protein